MTRTLCTLIGSFALLGLFLGLAGCNGNRNVGVAAGTPSDEEAALFRSQYLLTAEPDSAKTVNEARNDLSDSEAPEDGATVSVVGQIGGMPNPYGETQAQFPWRDGEAVFFVVDPTTAAEFKGHVHEKGEECSFCLGKAREMVDTVAMVQLTGDEDKPLPFRADKLLGLEEGMTVVATGTASKVADMLVIDATGVYVQEAAEPAESNSAEGAPAEDTAAAVSP